MPQPGDQHCLEQIAGPAGKLISAIAQHLLGFFVPKLGQGQIGGMTTKSDLLPALPPSFSEVVQARFA